jgi:hypothetical protein
VTAFAYALIELLIDKGVLTEEELNERKRKVGERLVEKLKGDGMGVMLQGSEVDKYKFEGGATIDCENRVHLCKAACCRLGFALSRQDIEERVVKWDLSRPYMNRRGRTATVSTWGREVVVVRFTRTVRCPAVVMTAARISVFGRTLRIKL